MPNPIHWSIILCRTQGPVNLGMITRLCANLGIDDLRLVDAMCAIDDDDARRFANHARDDLALLPHFADLGTAIADCQLAVATTARVRDQRFGQAIALNELADTIATRHALRVALVFGNEADGLTNEELAQCSLHLHLDTPGTYSSYNLANAVAIVGHYCCCLLNKSTSLLSTESNPMATGSNPTAADLALVRRLEQYWLDSLERFNYFRGNRRREPFADQFRQLLNRLPLSKDDASTLFACLAQFNYYTFGNKGLVDNAADDDAQRADPAK